MKNPIVSIIIPTYNRVKYLEETLKSILLQEYVFWECIVVDDGSNDNTSEMVNLLMKSDSRFKYFKRSEDLLKGANSCRNLGFKLSTGAYINWFDDDDIMLPNFLSDKTSAIKNNTDLIIASGYSVDNLLQNRKPIIINPIKNIYRDFVLADLKILTPSILFKKEFLIGKELFSSQIKKCQEAELFSRLFFDMNKEQYIIIDSYNYLYRSHETSSSNINKKYRNDFKESEVFLLGKNLERGILLRDIELVSSSYRMLINLLFKATQNNHKKNIIYILDVFNKWLKKDNKFLIRLLFKVIKTTSYLNLSFLKLDLFFKKIPIRYVFK
jgi:glycosyltransferase involved in cell wall biosynthesis